MKNNCSIWKRKQSVGWVKILQYIPKNICPIIRQIYQIRKTRTTEYLGTHSRMDKEINGDNIKNNFNIDTAIIHMQRSPSAEEKPLPNREKQSLILRIKKYPRNGLGRLQNSICNLRTRRSKGGNPQAAKEKVSGKKTATNNVRSPREQIRLRRNTPKRVYSTNRKNKFPRIHWRSCKQSNQWSKKSDNNETAYFRSKMFLRQYKYSLDFL